LLLMAAPTAPLNLRSMDIRPRPVALAPEAGSRARAPLARRWILLALAPILAFGLVFARPASAWADPGEGRTDKLFEQLDAAQRAYLDAKAKVDASVARQQELAATLATIDVKLAVQQEAVGRIAQQAYLGSGFTAVSGILSTGSPRNFLGALSIINALATRQTNQVRELLRTQAEATAAQQGIDAEIAAQQELLQEMEARKQDAQQALWAVGGGQEVPAFSAEASVVAEPAPRTANGGWPTESLTVYEAATKSNITPRLAHARQQAIKAGFDKYYISCYRPQEDGGQHPRGRACDFAVESCTFCGNDAQGAAKTYGTNLAAFFVFNAQRLGVLYVIWYRQIWLPSSGWRSYSGCCGASQKHTNHVHLSVV